MKAKRIRKGEVLAFRREKVYAADVFYRRVTG